MIIMRVCESCKLKPRTDIIVLQKSFTLTHQVKQTLKLTEGGLIQNVMVTMLLHPQQ